jgi:hypothetical protein
MANLPFGLLKGEGLRRIVLLDVPRIGGLADKLFDADFDSPVVGMTSEYARITSARR